MIGNVNAADEQDIGMVAGYKRSLQKILNFAEAAELMINMSISMVISKPSNSVNII